MRKDFKKRLACVTALALALVMLAGCGSESTSEGAGNTEADSSITVESEPTKEDGAKELTQESLLDYPETPADQFSFTLVNDMMIVNSCISEDDVVVVPAMYEGSPVVGIGDYAMAEMKAKGIVLPDSIEYLGEGAFTTCQNLEYIHLGSGVKEASNGTFNMCTNLKQVIFPEGLEVFTGYPFLMCDNLEKIVLPASLIEMPVGIGVPATCPKAVVVAPEGSEAEKYAEMDGFPVEHP